MLRRVCCCASTAEICPVHVLWFKYSSKLEVGEKPWAEVSANEALAHLRETLHKLKVSVVD